jgi:hypothetical protein
MENDIASNYKIGTRRFANLLWESKTNSLVRKNPRYSKVAERYKEPEHGDERADD